MTRKTRSFRPSPALVISCVALFLALTGSALAVGLAKNSVRSAQIVDGTVRTVDLRDNSVTAPKIAADSVGSEEIAENAVESPEVAPESLTAADLGANSVGSSEIQPKSVGASELGTVTVRTNSASVANNGNGSVSVNCEAGEQVISGGGQPGHFGTEMTSSRPSGNGWLYQAKNNSGSEDTLTVFALCLAG
ncbi:MAG TPA: hypothetical protein VFX44_11590 [Solirubrobacterales bacterium]|nr:hypothetical protein [Solirubrobacterales bacterium]